VRRDAHERQRDAAGPPRPTPTWNGSPNRAPKPIKPMSLPTPSRSCQTPRVDDDAVQRLLYVQEFLERCDARMPWGISLEVSGVIRAELAALQRAADRAIERAR
jgi:hypothetical protein